MQLRVYQEPDEQAVIAFYTELGFDAEEIISMGKRLYT